MSNGKGNPRMSYDISIHGAEVVRDTIKKQFERDVFPDFKEAYISVSLDQTKPLDPKAIHFWVGKEGAAEIPDHEILLGIWDHGKQLYSMDGLLMSGMNFTNESVAVRLDHPERYSGSKGDLMDAMEGYIFSKEETIGFYKGNIIKYTQRFNKKNGLEDLNKAGVYLERLKQFVKEYEGEAKTNGQ